MDEDKRVVILPPARMQSAEYLRQDWVATAEEGTTIEDVLDPAYWAHMAAQMQAMAHIEVRFDTGEYLLELLVLQVGRNWAKVRLLHKHELEAVDPEAPGLGRCEVKWGGPTHKWRVIRKADNEAVSSGHATKEEAASAMDRYERTIATT